MFFQEGMSEYRPGNELDTKYVDLLKENFIQDVANIQDVNFAEENGVLLQMFTFGNRFI